MAMLTVAMMLDIGWLDQMILDVFSNLDDSIISWFYVDKTIETKDWSSWIILDMV